MRLVILDRDGVINRDSDEFIKSAHEWVPIPGSLRAIARLSRAGYAVAVATNQSGVGRGLFDEKALDAIHDRMRQAIRAGGGTIAAVRVCPHAPDDDCRCRKPSPVMLEDLARSFGVEPADVWVVGDAARDVEAARRAGMRPALVRTGKGSATIAGGADLRGVVVFEDLAGFAEALLSRASRS